jgi:hypothetical protein
MHRLLAEEAFTQQTIIDRHSQWNDPRNLRYLRRAIQGLNHGFRSVGMPSNFFDFTRVVTNLPLGPGEAFRHLYAVRYRDPLEVPPYWEFSRRLGGDRIKAELLWVALTSPGDDPPPSLSDGPDQRQVIESLREVLYGNKSGDWSDNDRLLIRDLCANLLRAAQQSHNSFTEWIEKLTKNHFGPTTVTETDRKAQHSFTPPDHQTAMQQKAETDIALLRERPDAALPRYRDFLIESGFQFESFDQQLSEIAGQLAPVANVEDPPREYDQYLLTLAESFAAVPPALLAYWCDLLCRHAELMAQEADQEADTAHFLKAYLLFELVDSLRTRVFASQPLGRGHIPGARPTGIHIRVCLKLMSLCPRRRDYYFRRARQLTDRITPYVARYPSERANLLILEATMARVAREDLDTPLRLLAEADRLLASLPTYNHDTRFRLLLERTKVFRRKAVHSIATSGLKPPSRETRSLLDAAADDAGILRCHADDSDSRPWERVAEEECQKISKLCGDYTYRSSASGPFRFFWVTTEN